MPNENQTTAAEDRHIEMPEEYVGRQAGAATGQEGSSVWGDDEQGSSVWGDDEAGETPPLLPTVEENPLLMRFVTDPWVAPPPRPSRM